jgi:hypothetical protein
MYIQTLVGKTGISGREDRTLYPGTLGKNRKYQTRSTKYPCTFGKSSLSGREGRINMVMQKVYSKEEKHNFFGGAGGFSARYFARFIKIVKRNLAEQTFVN